MPAAALPREAGKFIAYGPQERVAHPVTGDPVTIRSQILVSYYPEIMVLQIHDGGRDGKVEGLVTVDFDPQSVPGGRLTRSISGHMDDDDVTVNRLRQAFEKQIPVAVAIETQRKKKNSETRVAISPLTHIHSVRGAADASGSKSDKMQGTSGANIANRIAMVDGVGTKHLLSNPAEWAALVTNKDGSLPPDGWDNLATGDTWEEVGAAIKSAGAPAAGSSVQGGAAIDMNGIQQLLDATIRRVLDETGTSCPGRQHGKFYEGKPWEPRTSDGRVNLGGYIVSAEKWAFTWAYKYLVDTVGEDGAADETEAWELADYVMQFADHVQAQAYGRGVEVDRAATSHREATDWVKWEIEHQHPWSEHDDDVQAWGRAVIAGAQEHLSTAGQRAGAYLASKAKTPPSQQKPRGDNQGQAPRTEQSQETTDDAPQQQGSEPSDALVDSTLDAVRSSWTNADALGRLGGEISTKGLDALPVVPARTDDGSFALARSTKENPHARPLVGVIRHQWETLRAAQDHGQQQPDEQPTQGPSRQAPARQQPHEEPSPAPRQGQGPAPSNTGSNQDLVNGYERPLGQSISAVHAAQNARDMDALHRAYEEIRGLNLQGSTIYAEVAQNGSVTFGANHTEGMSKCTLGQALHQVRTHLEELQGTGGQAVNAAAPTRNAEQPPTHDEDADERAQQIADEVTDGMDPAGIQALIDRAETANLLNVSVNAMGRSGKPVSTKLDKYLAANLRAAKRNGAEAQG